MQQLLDRWRPKHVVLEHLANGTITPIAVDYWLPVVGPPAALYAPTVDEEAFRPRIVRYLDTLGLGERIREELARADAAVLRWEEKWGRAKEGVGP